MLRKRKNYKKCKSVIIQKIADRHLEYAKAKYISQDYVINAMNEETYVDDETFEEIDARDDEVECYNAIDEEFEALNENNTWTLPELPPGKNSHW